MEWFLKVLKHHYADFNGRARRKEYWMFVLFQMIIIYGLIILGGLTEISFIGILALIVMLALFIPSIAVGVRRMHDVGQSGWFLLVPIVSFIFACTDSVPGKNKYGDNPKGIGNNKEIEQIGNE